MLNKKTAQKVACALTVAATVSMAGTVVHAEPSYNNVNTPPVIVMDLAHNDTQGDVGASYKEVKERDLVNEISDMATDILVKKGFTVIYTRQHNQPASLRDRVKVAQGCEYAYYISIHANSCEKENTGTGVESYYNGASAQRLGDKITDDLSTEFDLPQRCDRKSQFYTRRIQESVLIEIGFINHIKDRDILLKNKQRIAEIIANDIIESYQMDVSQK